MGSLELIVLHLAVFAAVAIVISATSIIASTCQRISRSRSNGLYPASSTVRGRSVSYASVRPLSDGLPTTNTLLSLNLPAAVGTDAMPPNDSPN